MDQSTIAYPAIEPQETGTTSAFVPCLPTLPVVVRTVNCTDLT